MLGRFTKQSTETHDYVFDWTDYFAERTDAHQSHTVTADAGLTVVSSTYTNNVLTVLVSGGTNGVRYKVTIRLTTTSGVVEEDEFFVTIRDE